MLRGEVRLVDLEPVRGSEPNQRRPAVVLTNDRADATAPRLGRGVVTVVPITSNTTKVFPFQAPLPAAESGLRVDAKAQAEQVRSVAVERVCEVHGFVAAGLMAEVDDALRLHLRL